MHVRLSPSRFSRRNCLLIRRINPSSSNQCALHRQSPRLSFSTHPRVALSTTTGEARKKTAAPARRVITTFLLIPAYRKHALPPARLSVSIVLPCSAKAHFFWRPDTYFAPLAWQITSLMPSDFSTGRFTIPKLFRL